MKLIVGLGNPGRAYDHTRHNVGFMVVDRLVERHVGGHLSGHTLSSAPRARFHATVHEARLVNEACLFIKPNVYVNRSGQCVGECVRFHKADPLADLVVLVDDVNLPTGSVRVRGGGGTGGHNGLADIQRSLGTDAFPRVRIGIGASPAYMDQADYVLGRFTEFEMAAIRPAIDRAADAVETFVGMGIDAAMNKHNTQISSSKAPDDESDSAPPGWIST